MSELGYIYQEAVAIGRTFAAMKDYQIDGNKEMVALGAMNIAGSMTSCYVATGRSRLFIRILLAKLSQSTIFNCRLCSTHRFVLPIGSEFHGRIPNRSFQHRDVHRRTFNVVIHHTSF